MFKFLVKNKKGFSLVELLAVLLLLSLGFVALGNMFRVTYRAFNKAEERYVKQEEVKLVAEMLRKGATNVAAASYADVFDTTKVVPTKEEIDTDYSYLYFEPHRACATCGADWNTVDNACPNADSADEGECEKSEVDGYFLKCLNSGTQRNCDLNYVLCSEAHCKCTNTETHYCKDCSICQCTDKAIQLSSIPIYVSFKPMTEEVDKIMETTDPETGKTTEIEYKEYRSSCGVTVTLAALEDDFVYESKTEMDEKGNPKLEAPISDDIYYSLDVAFHFPNMVISSSGATVNFARKGKKSTAVVYDENGKKIKQSISTDVENETGTVTETVNIYESVEATNIGVEGNVLRIQSSSIIKRDTANASLKTPKLCFIATASYGRDSGEVGLLCKFRDECLLTNPLGTAFVKAYYKLSPPIAEFIADSEPLKAAVRVGLKPLVAVATNALDSEAATENAPWFILFMLCGAGTTATLIKISKRRKKIKE